MIDSRLIAALPTPALVIDSVTVRNNIRRMAEYARDVGLSIRPHTKTHKLRHLARMQLEAGAGGITAAKVSEAEVLSGPNDDVLLAYPPVGDWRAQRMALLARDRTVRAAVDSMAAIESASAAARAVGTAIGLLVDLDVGMGRTGVQTPSETLALAQAVDRAPNVNLDGIMIYPGHIWNDPREQQEPLEAVSELLDETIGLWTEHGFEARIVSGGSTPTAYQSHYVRHLTEIRPGTYVLNDMNTVRGGLCTLDDCAARVIATVISDAVPGQVVVDAGSKTLTSDRCASISDSDYGHVMEYPQARITRLTEEHGQMDVTDCSARPRVGERLTIIPNHICPCVNLQDAVWWLEPDEPPQQLRVDARGKLW